MVALARQSSRRMTDTDYNLGIAGSWFDGDGLRERGGRERWRALEREIGLDRVRERL